MVVFIWGFTIFQFGFPPSYWSWQQCGRVFALSLFPARLWNWQLGDFLQVQIGSWVVWWCLEALLCCCSLFFYTFLFCSGKQALWTAAMFQCLFCPSHSALVPAFNSHQPLGVLPWGVCLPPQHRPPLPPPGSDTLFCPEATYDLLPPH